MNSITQDLKFRQSLLVYAEKHGVAKAATKYQTNRQYIYRWHRRYDGTLDSLRYRSRRPHSHPKQHTEKELKLIRNMRRRPPHDRPRRALDKAPPARLHAQRLRPLPLHAPHGLETGQLPEPQEYTSKPYKEALFPGGKVQIDVKVVPKVCIT